MIGIVRLFPNEPVLTKELTLVVWYDKLYNICVRVLFQRREWWWMRCSQKWWSWVLKQRSQWEHYVSNFGSNSDCALCIDQRGACVRKTNCVSCTWFIIKIGKEELFQKEQKVGQQESEISDFVWEFFDDLVIRKTHPIAFLDIIMKTGPPPAV